MSELALETPDAGLNGAPGEVREATSAVLTISAERFLDALRTTGFGDLVRNLRNERVHGSA